MRRILLSMGLLPLLVAALAAQTPSVPAAPPPAKQPLTALPYTPGLDVTSLDRTHRSLRGLLHVRLRQLADEESHSGRSGALERVREAVRRERAAAVGTARAGGSSRPGRSPSEQKIGDFFASCMDEAKIDGDGAAPVLAELKAVDAITSKSELAGYIGREQLSLGDDGLGFGFGSNQDLADSSQVIAFADSGGLGLPDRDYYTKTDRRSSRSAAQVRGAHRQDVRTDWSAGRSRRGKRAHGHGARDGARERFADQRGQARSLQAAPQDGPGRPRSIDAGVQMGRLPRGAGLSN